MTDVTQQPVQASSTPDRTRDQEREHGRELQPLLHDLATAVAAPALVLGTPDGQVDSDTRPVSGWYADDVRLLRRAVLSVEHSPLELVRGDVAAPARHAFSYVARGLGDVQPDPTVRVERVRDLGATELHERVAVTSAAREPVEAVLHLDVATDLAPVPEVKQGARPDASAPRITGAEVRWGTGDGSEVVLEADGAEVTQHGDGVRLTWRLSLPAGASAEVAWRARSTGEARYDRGRLDLGGVVAEAPDPRLPALLRRSLDDLEALALREGDDTFLAAGSPWFLTLFGRDSLWAARLLLPVDHDLALSTLRVLAARQGEVDDPEIEEQPGKILHEVRSPGLGHSLPPVYYGTVDATPLFVCLLADAAEWGADPEQVRALLPAARRALQWQLAQSAETGWLRYVDSTGRGLANQGWKDSHDSVQHADGRLADAPIALCEVQAYAHEAAVRGGALLAAYGEEPVEGLEQWAADLRDRFDREFWVDTPDGGHVAIALDRDGRPVDSVTSNVGHLLGTGILAPGRAARLAEVLVGELRSGFGLHTLTPRSPRFSPLSYHGGSVWPHDTAIAVRGLAAEGCHDEATRLAAEVVDAAAAFDLRLPELFAGDRAYDVRVPAAYPAACRPQAWSAAGAVAALLAATGVRVEAGAPAVPDRTGTALGPFRLHGLRLGERSLGVEVAADGSVTLLEA
ncbi:glycogen debranching N-terminal domain-containing protein [Nocardioides marmoraquaticus]